MAAGVHSGRPTPLEGIHEIIDRQPDGGMCIDLVCAYFGADRALDPGPGQPLAVRLGMIGPSIVDDAPPHIFGEALAFGLGDEHEVGGEVVQFYDGLPGRDIRFAYAVADPERDVIHARSEGGWIDIPTAPVLNRVFSTITGRLVQLAPSETCVDWGWYELETPLQVEPNEMCRNSRALLLGVNGWLDVANWSSGPKTLYVGRDVIVRIGPRRLLVAGATDGAVRATGLTDVGDPSSVRVQVWKTDQAFAGGPGGAPPPEVVQSWLDALPESMELDRLDDVEWSQLFHAYGAADDVPAMLLDLAEGDGNGDFDDENSGLHGLFNAVVHQNSTYSSTAFVVPFVGHLLSTRPELRSILLSFLAHATFRSSYPELPTFDDDCWTDRWTIAAADRLSPLLLGLAAASDERTASAALEVLGQLPGVAAETFDALASASGPAAAAHVAYIVLGVTGRAVGRGAGELPLPDEGASPEVLLAWGIARCLLGDPGGVPTVLESLDRGSGFRVFFKTDRALALEALRPVDGGLRNEDVERLIEGAPADRVETIWLLAPAVFPDGAPAHPGLMSDLQRSFVSTIRGLIASGLWMYGDAAIGMSVEALERYVEGDFDPTL